MNHVISDNHRPNPKEREAPDNTQRSWLDFQLWVAHEDYRKGLEDQYEKTFNLNKYTK